ncbi:hypothetical protein GDO86_016505 [Hymenochirus boettgeri]|uniref:Extracellular matrix protein 1 n=1 Tax=Hymenochirus boettgeri TaxID=247094 RepID=A0A8T2JX91_9PIPI|nr:hypothetical protein GDO86_016505 [Hymenochirus boettgeri]
MNFMVPWLLTLPLLLAPCQALTGEEQPIDYEGYIYQREIIPEFPLGEQAELVVDGLNPRGRRPTLPDRASPVTNDLIDFPPGRPSRSNIVNICHKKRPKISYGPHNLPQTGFSYLSRQGDVINYLEIGYTDCCLRRGRLPCAEKVWKNTLENFCIEEFSIKTRHYHCCKKKQGTESEVCFHNEAPNPSYKFAFPLEIGSADEPSVTQERSPNRCSPSSSHCKKERKRKVLDLAFPPGEPKSGNIQNICRLRKLRPTYTKSQLPTSGFGYYVRQAKAINRLENEYKKCCKDENVACAHIAWEKELAEFCVQEREVFTKPHECCEKRANTYSCFASKAPYPEYDREVEKFNLGNLTVGNLQKLCGEVKILTKQKQIPLLLSGIRDSCCNIPVNEMLECADDQNLMFIEALCGDRKELWKDSLSCCTKSDMEKVECFDVYLQNVLVAISHRNNQD